MDESIGNMTPLELRHLLATFLNDTSMNPKPDPIKDKDVDARAGIKRYKQGLGIRSVSTNTTVQSTDDLIIGTGALGPIQVTLPDPQLNQGRTISVKNSSTNLLSVARFSAADTVDNTTAVSLVVNQSVELAASGTDWAIVGGTKLPAGSVAASNMGFPAMQQIYNSTAFGAVATLDTNVFAIPTGTIGLRIAWAGILASGGPVSIQGRFNNTGGTAYSYFSYTVGSSTITADAQNIDGQSVFRAGVASSTAFGISMIDMPFANTAFVTKFYEVAGTHASVTARYCNGYYNDSNPITRVQILAPVNFVAGAQVTVWAY